MIFAIGVAVALTACVNNEQFDDAAPKEVSFKGFNLGESTRATFDGTEFMVYAQFSNAGDGTDYKNYWGDAAKEITEQDGAWKVNETTKYYWPKAGAISFWGYYPKSQAGVTFDATNGVKVADVDPAEAAVLMLADPAESKLKTANDVPMVFKHAGAQVIFRIANASIANNFNLTITGVSISNVSMLANYKWDEWSDWADSAATISNDDDVAISEAAIGSTDLYTFNVIPQAKDENGAKKITINYTVEDTNAGYSYNATATFDATDWVINTKHYYNVTFNFTAGEEIEFAPETTEWATSQHDFAVTD
ncbi:MAG: fimbrillin family protein [Tidjanibacter sp.]|nr:fimbrillin family protein [Tidjanibacter sp.]